MAKTLIVSPPTLLSYTQPPFLCPPASTAGIAGTAGTNLLGFSANLLRSFSSYVVVSHWRPQLACQQVHLQLFLPVQACWPVAPRPLDSLPHGTAPLSPRRRSPRYCYRPNASAMCGRAHRRCPVPPCSRTYSSELQLPSGEQLRHPHA